MWPFCGHFQIHIRFLGMGSDRIENCLLQLAVFNQIDCPVSELKFQKLKLQQVKVRILFLPQSSHMSSQFQSHYRTQNGVCILSTQSHLIVPRAFWYPFLTASLAKYTTQMKNHHLRVSDVPYVKQMRESLSLSGCGVQTKFRHNLEVKLTAYRIAATSVRPGMIQSLGSLMRAAPVIMSMASPIENTDAASEIGAGCFANVTDCAFHQITSNTITRSQMQ